MIRLSQTSQKLQLNLASGTTTNALHAVVNYNIRTTTSYGPGSCQFSSITSSGDNDILDAPATSGDVREIDLLTVRNRDTVAATVIVKVDISGTDYELWKGTLTPGDTLEYTHGSGWKVTDSSGNIKPASANSSQNYRKNSTGSVYTRPRLNIIEGSGVTVTLADDSSDNEVDVTIAASGGSGSPLTTKGDLYTYSTTNARLAVGTDGQALVADSAATTGNKWTWQNVVQRSYDEYTANTSLSTRIPADDTIPQNTEGTEILSRAFTPKSASNRIRIWFCGVAGPSTTTYITGALFVDSTANALAACINTNPTNYQQPLVLLYEESAASTSARTYKIRVGSDSGTCRMNGDSAGRYLGGTMRAVLMIEEIVP